VSEGLDRKWRGASAAIQRSTGWDEQEEKLAQLQPGGRRQQGSGCARAASKKGDGTGDLFLISAKTTEKKGMRLERDWLEEIERQARNVGQLPALFIGFDRDGADDRLDWLGFPERTAKLLIDIAVAARDGELSEARALAGLLGNRTSPR